MAHFLRLIVALLLLFSSAIYADTIPAQLRYKIQTSNSTEAYFNDMDAGCVQFGQWHGALYGWGYTSISSCVLNSSNVATMYKDGSGNNRGQYNIGIREYYCATGTLNNSTSPPTCTVAACPEGQTRQADGSCAKPCETGYVSGVTGSSYFGSDGGTDCLNNCTYSLSISVCATLSSGQGACVGSYGNGTGASCSAATNNTALTPEANCMSQGKSFISVGGVTSCVSAGSQGSTPIKTKDSSSSSSSGSTKDADGNTTGTTSGSSTTNSTATFNGDGTVIVVTTTEKTNEDGTKETKTETKTVSQTSYCAENPTAAQCKAATDSDISGACDAVACKGDAIQCAMAKEQARRNCEWFKENATAKALGEAMADGTDTTPNPADSSNRETVNVQSSLDSSSPISASCFTDVTVTLLGQSATLPLSDWCPFFEALGYIFLALSYMAALRIVAGVIV
jgi:hypothetical protein